MAKPSIEYPEGMLQHILNCSVTPRPDCTIWNRATSQGYGVVTIMDDQYRVHRVMWELANGPIPEGLTIDHLCRVRGCVNTGHMELVTPLENTQRAVAYRTDRALPLGAIAPRNRGPRRVPPNTRTHCARGHELTPDNIHIEKPAGHVRCLTCLRASRRRYDDKRRRRRDSA